MQSVVSLKNRLVLSFLFSLSFLSAQNLTYYADIQPIINDKCVKCHRKGQIAPFELTTFESVNRRAKFISKVINERYMPPSPADPSVSTFKNVKNLSQDEINKIDLWIAKGKQKGVDPKRIQAESSTTSYREPDLILTLQKPFTIKGNNQEQFRVFVVPTNAKEDLFIEGIDFLPENKQFAHHCRFMIDTTNKLRIDDGIEVGAESEYQKLGVKMNDNFWHGWIPGNTAIFYPEGTAKRLPKGSDIILNMHYAPSSNDVVENPKILLYLSKKVPERLVKTFILEENAISNQPFYINKDTIVKYYMRSPIIPYDISLISITPHMHLLGKNFKAFAITSDGDLINLIKINNWDFNWQMTYQFEQLLKIPRGSVVYAEAEYDNTTQNKRNPYLPTRDVTYGWGIKNEMMNLIFQYLDYQPNDETSKK
jgi:Copper type II ascorbate-dependent monooxygenase, C-terminal domain